VRPVSSGAGSFGIVPTPATVDLGHVTLGYRTTGSPDGLPVVLLHGLGEDAAGWDRFAAELADRGRQAIAVDLRGHGTSSHPGEYSFELMAGDVLAFLASLGLTRIDLVGHSMGGMVAQLVAVRSPDLVRRLVIEDAPPAALDSPGGDPDPPSPPAEPTPFDWAAVSAIRVDARTPDPARWAALRRITAPTLWLSGGPASHVDPSRSVAAATATPTADLVTIAVGHNIHDDAPAEFAAAVLPHLSTVADATT
jgi:pimeloyl-ACP methyl ester carboxylesterase